MNTTPNTDQPHTADCDTCGASHVFDNRADAEDFQANHGDMGHHVNIEEA